MAARVFATLVAVLAVLAGCTRPASRSIADGSAGARRTVRDTLGRELSLPAEVRRVVSLAPSTTEILYAVGAGPLLVGVDGYSDYPPAVAAVEKVGADIDPSLERILALRPDVVFTAKTANAQGTVEALDRLHLAVYVSRTDSLADITADVLRIAEAVGHGPDGARLQGALAKRLAAVRARVAAAPPLKALVVVWPEPLIVAGGATHVDEMIRYAGGENVAHDSPQAYPTYSLERLLAQAPEAIVIGTHAGANLGVPAALARLSSLPAVRSGRIRSLDGDLIFRPGPRMVEGIELMAALFHPPPVFPPLPPGAGATP